MNFNLIARRTLCRFLKSIAVLCLAASCLSGCRLASSIYFDDAPGDQIILGNRTYEIHFSKENGGIASIVDKTSSQPISLGNANGCLWSATFSNIPPANEINACKYSRSGANRFSYTWSAAEKQLTLHYAPDPTASRQATASVTVSPSESQYFDLQLVLQNNWNSPSQNFNFPLDLAFSRAGIEQALLPVMPGIALEPGFFERGTKYEADYPGWPGVFADFMWLTSSQGSLAIYPLAESERSIPTRLGFHFDHCAGEQNACYTHLFKAVIPDRTTWSSPIVRVTVSAELDEVLDRFRDDDALSDAPPFITKLGARYAQTVGSPLYKADAAQLGLRFADYAELLAHVPSPGLIHLVSYWPRGFDENYPDLLPPDPQFGSLQDMVAMFAAAHAAGFLVMPYTNPTWWDDESPTLQNLPDSLTVTDLAVLDAGGSALYECYGCPTFSRYGIVTSPYAPYVQDRLAKLLQQMKQQVPSDFIFEDQIGARAAPFDYNPASPAPQAYLQGWIDHTRANASDLLMTEDGFDRLVATETGFNGSVLLSERRRETIPWWGTSGWHYYPLVTRLARDKVLFYQHDLAPESFTHGKSTLSWNIAMGYMLSYDLVASDWGGGVNSNWIKVVSDFQKYVLSLYADERISDYRALHEGATRTSFVNFTVVANWDPHRSYSTGAYDVSPLGVMIQGNDGSLIAGVFTYYNHHALSGGDHYLIEERKPGEIIVRQPMGIDTSLTLQVLPAWSADQPVEAHAYTRAGQELGKVPLSTSAGSLTFTYQMLLDNQPVAYYRLFTP
jgi:hypothetical protein